jgi:hypothetical protein
MTRSTLGAVAAALLASLVLAHPARADSPAEYGNEVDSTGTPIVPKSDEEASPKGGPVTVGDTPATGTLPRSTRGRLDRLDVELRDLWARGSYGHESFTELRLGYRMLPDLTLGLYFGATLFGSATADDGCAASDTCYQRHVRFGGFGLVHFAPNAVFDPWLSLGVGGATYHHLGVDAEASAGLDLRMGTIMAFGPMVTHTQGFGGEQTWNAYGVHLLFTF